MKQRLDKCEFFRQQVTYLGHVISADGLKPSEEGVDAIVKIPTHENTKQRESIIGKLNYYGMFLPSFSTICAPLNRQRRQDRVWCETASRQVWVLPTTSHMPGTRDLSRWSETIRRRRRRNCQDSDAREHQTAGKHHRQTELLRNVPTVVINHMCPSKPTAQTGR